MTLREIAGNIPHILNEPLRRFASITLEEMASGQPLNQTTIRVLVPVESLAALLGKCRENYRALENNGLRVFRYETVYFDTPLLDFYRKQHTGKLNRYKVRQRHYLDSKQAFFELKFKPNKGPALKNRTLLSKPLRSVLDEEFAALLANALPDAPDNLRPAVISRFYRATLILKSRYERVTIDTDITFSGESRIRHLPSMAIIEVRRNRSQRILFFLTLLTKPDLKEQSLINIVWV